MRCMPWAPIAANAALAFLMRSRCRARGAGLQERHVDCRGSPRRRGFAPLFSEARIVRTGASGLWRRPSARATSARRSRWSGAGARAGGCPRRPRRVQQDRGKRRRHARARGRSLATLSAWARRSERGSGRSWSRIRSNKIATPKSVSWLSRRDELLVKRTSAKAQSLTDKPPNSAQCKLILLHVIDFSYFCINYAHSEVVETAIP